MTAPQTKPKDPQDYPRRILLMVTGRTPQVVTETLFALCLRQAPPFVPTEVRLITTSEGADDARLSLLSEDPGWFHALQRDYGLPEIGFSADGIVELQDLDGHPLPDIRTRDENDRAADQIVACVRDRAEIAQASDRVVFRESPMKRALLRSANSGQGKPSVALFLYPQRTLSIRGKCAHSKICSKAPNAGYCANLWSFSIDSVYYVEPGRRTNPSTASVARKDALCSQMLASAYPDRSIGGAAISRRSAAPWPAPGC